MNWVEQLIHLDPDGGTGLFEAALALLAAVGTGVALRRRARSGRSSNEGRTGA